MILLVAAAGVLALMGRPLRVRGAELSEIPGPEGDRRRRAAEALVVILVVALVVAWIASQVAPAWTTRYFSVLVGPAIVFAGIGLAHARGLGIAALAVLVLFWSGDRAGELNAKSNVRSVTPRVLLRPVAPGDLVVSTHPEQVPVLHYYLAAASATPTRWASSPTRR